MNPQRTVLLLNVSNLKTSLMYPYAFVQVSEIAARFGIRTICNDLYGISEDQWEIYLRKLLQNDSYDMVLITLRNTDAIDINDYIVRSQNYNYHQPINLPQHNSPSYYPIQATKRLIQVLRKLIGIPIVVGGYAFSMLPEKLMSYLRPDYGVIGGSDAFFEHFEEVLTKQNLGKIANLIYFQTDSLKKGPFHFFPPASRCEYNDEIIADRQAFYSRFLGEVVDPRVPIEVARGCSMYCSFCSEPLVEGRTVQYRDLDVIEEEISFLRKYQLNNLFFICSEVNTDNNEFFMSLADRLIAINKGRKDYEKVSWHTLFLMTLSAEELKHIRRAGFRGGSNDVISLDDENLAANKAPLKSEDIIRFFTQAKEVVREEFKQKGKTFHSLEERIFNTPRSLNPDDFMNSWNVFLGNLDVTPKTIRVTLQCADEAGLNNLFDSCYVNKATRIYDFINVPPEALKHTWTSIDGVIKRSYNELFPSYTFPPVLLQHFGNEKTVEEFMILVGDTYLSHKHLFKKDWNWFLASNLEPKTFLLWWISTINSEPDFKTLTMITEVLDFLTFLSKNPSLHKIKLLFNPTPGRKNLMNFSAHIAIQSVLFSHETKLIPVLHQLGLPSSLKATLNLSPFKFAVKIFEFHSERDALLNALEKHPEKELAVFFTKYLIYLNNTPLGKKYQPFFSL